MPDSTIAEMIEEMIEEAREFHEFLMENKHLTLNTILYMMFIVKSLYIIFVSLI